MTRKLLVLALLMTGCSTVSDSNHVAKDTATQSGRHLASELVCQGGDNGSGQLNDQVVTIAEPSNPMTPFSIYFPSADEGREKLIKGKCRTEQAYADTLICTATQNGRPYQVAVRLDRGFARLLTSGTHDYVELPCGK